MRGPSSSRQRRHSQAARCWMCPPHVRRPQKTDPPAAAKRTHIHAQPHTNENNTRIVTLSVGGRGRLADHNVHAQLRSGVRSWSPRSKSVGFHVSPPSIDTSTRWTPKPPPLHAYPVTETASPSSTVELGAGDVIADCTGIACIAGAAFINSAALSHVAHGGRIL